MCCCHVRCANLSLKGVHVRVTATVLTSCTRRPAECVVTQDLAMQAAEELAQYDKICM